MAVPKKRTTSAKRNHRRSHHGVARLHLSPCSQCKQPVVGHVACPNCGTYKGRATIDVLAKLEKKDRRAKAQELETQAASADEHNHEGHDHATHS